MKEFIKKLIDKYSKQIEKDIIGCGLRCSDYEALTKEVEMYVDELFSEIIGERPTADSASPEYEEWYRKFLVFCEVMEKFGKKYGRKYTYYPTPKNLQNHYGPRD